MFRRINSKVNFPSLEESVLNFWKERDIFKQSLELRRTGPIFVFYEGPPTANGNPGIHHALARVFKDVICRYWTMKGYYVPRKAGWDTHGLPVELEIEKELGFTNKAQIEDYGIAKFNALCRQSVFRYINQWEAMTKRLGFWLDMEHPYITLSNDYIESCWWIIKQLWDKGLIYQGYKVTPHCPRCSTSLSSHEVALGYRDDVEDPSVYIKFRVDPTFLEKESSLRSVLDPLSSNKPIFLLAWTTTPWTLPGNTALAVAIEEDYAVMEGEEDSLILAVALAEKVEPKGYRKVTQVKGKELVGLRYEPLFNPHHFGVERKRFSPAGSEVCAVLLTPPVEANLRYPVIGADFISLEEGTGIVHIAPAFGEVDFEAGEKEGLDFVQPVDLDGIVKGDYSFAGRFVKEADPLIIDDLKSRGLLYHSERIIHTYPFCWRCDSPLLYYAKRSWYIKTTSVKDKLIIGNEEINWYPKHIKYGRFGNWLENNVDWAFSRERYWGTPLNIWQCSSCNNYECVGSLKELKGKPGLVIPPEPLDLHRPFVDNITFACSQCNGKMSRLLEVADCWFDSGAMPVAQWHYPFENRDEFQKNFPADFICEAVDQTRGWFYSLHALSVLLFGKPCFENVICLGHILDARGEKMSKARGNVVDPWAIMNKYGAEALRWYLLVSSPAGNVRCFSTEMVEEARRKFLNTLWNTYSFFVIYANIDHFSPEPEAVVAEVSELDRWILSELNKLIRDVSEDMDNYEPTRAGRKIEEFVDNLSNWYVRRSRRRFWKSENDADKLAAYNTLYQCLVTLAKILAPFTPFLAEELYQNLVRSVNPEAAASVHLADFPVADKSKIDEQLASDIQLVMKVCSLGRAARSKAGIKVRQPLAKVYLKLRTKMEIEALSRLMPQVIEELNVKECEVVEELPQDTYSHVLVKDGDYFVAISTQISSELRAEGLARELVHRLQNMRRTAGYDIADRIITYYQGESYIEEVVASFAEYIKQETLSSELIRGVPGEDTYIERFRIDNKEVLLGVKRL